jgi:two-component system OmpR family sensor kinase
MKRQALLFLPAIIGLLLAGVWQSELWPNPVLYLRIDVGSLFLFVGLTGSLLGGASWALWANSQRHGEYALDQLHQKYSALHHQFIRRLDHEIKNPLMAIRAALANMVEVPLGNGAPALASVHTQVDRLARLSADLRKLVDLETQPIEREEIDMVDLLTELLELAQQRPEAAGYRLELVLSEVPWPLPSMMGDRDLVFIALHNVVDNALKFCDPGDAIEIRAFEDGPSISVEVADTGPGIHPDDLPHVGEELYRGRSSSAEGSGLGLALVRTIVERHGGTLALRSRWEQGTVVTLRFPAVRKESRPLQ